VEKLIETRELYADFNTFEGVVKALNGVNVVVNEGETYGLVGESGCGKSVTVRSMMRIVQAPGRIASGKVVLSGTGEPGSTLEILDNGMVVASVVVSTDGTWSVGYATPPGQHTFTVRVRGQATEGSTAASATVTVPVPAGGISYVVKQGEWLVQLARRYYGDPGRWLDIYEATNAKAAHDRSYHKIADPNVVWPGWKIWFPGP